MHICILENKPIPEELKKEAIELQKKLNWTDEGGEGMQISFVKIIIIILNNNNNNNDNKNNNNTCDNNDNNNINSNININYKIYNNNYDYYNNDSNNNNNANNMVIVSVLLICNDFSFKNVSIAHYIRLHCSHSFNKFSSFSLALVSKKFSSFCFVLVFNIF